jgi:ribosomal protein S18 acetylase RimI-like enzyme
MSQPEIKQASSKDIPNIIDTVALAFAADPFVRWIYPDPNQYLSHIHKMAILFAGKAFDHGTVHYVEGYRGTALWLPPDIHPDEDALVAHMNNSILEPSREAVFAVFEQMEESHPDESHWYLPVLAVDPAQQNNGYGSRLLEYANKMFDKERIPAYLESSNPRNISLYKRHGYEVITEIPAGDSPVTPMVRQPH